VPVPQHVERFLADVLRADRARVLARVVAVVGDLQLAEDALQEACVEATIQWPRGLPANPQGWLVTVARRRAIDQYRSLSAAARRELTLVERAATWTAPDGRQPVEDDRLRLIFTCAHPALAPETRVALTLQVVGGLPAADIAAAFLVSDSAMSQRIVRGKRKIRAARIPYRIPGPDEWPARLATVLAVVYLIFNAGYLAPSGGEAIRVDLLDEALRLSDLLVELVDDAEVLGLSALLYLTDARRNSRRDATGALVDLTEQDRSTWDQGLIRRGLDRLTLAHARGAPGPYQLQAMIAAVHARSPSPDATDWTTITQLYDGLLVLVPSPTVAMNRAVAIAHARGAREGLALLDERSLAEALSDHHRYHAARAHLLELAGDDQSARSSWARAHELARSDHERASLSDRVTALGAYPTTDHLDLPKDALDPR
jgi:RNA polymerase sigma-70 factor (ECF subfamily)